MTQITDPNPPSLLEIVGLPVAGAVAIECFHNRSNELILLCAPIVVSAFRLFVAQFQVPSVNVEEVDERASRALRNCIAINQIAVFVLILVEAGENSKGSGVNGIK